MRREETSGDISNYIRDIGVGTDDEIIELACALANINRLHEVGEIAFSSDELFETGQLSIIRQLLKSVAETDLDHQESLVKLYKKLQQYHL